MGARIKLQKRKKKKDRGKKRATFSKHNGKIFRIYRLVAEYLDFTLTPDSRRRLERWRACQFQRRRPSRTPGLRWIDEVVVDYAEAASALKANGPASFEDIAIEYETALNHSRGTVLPSPSLWALTPVCSERQEGGMREKREGKRGVDKKINDQTGNTQRGRYTIKSCHRQRHALIHLHEAKSVAEKGL